jgi:hypothetical protein
LAALVCREKIVHNDVNYPEFSVFLCNFFWLAMAETPPAAQSSLPLKAILDSLNHPARDELDDDLVDESVPLSELAEICRADALLCHGRIFS